MVDGGALVVFTHTVVVGVFDRTGPEIVQYGCDSVLSEVLPCISVFDSETGAEGPGAQHFHRLMSCAISRSCLRLI